MVIVLHNPTTPWSWHPYCCPVLWGGGGHEEGAATSGKESGLLWVFFPLLHANLHSWAKDLQASEELSMPRQQGELGTLPLSHVCGGVPSDRAHVVLSRPLRPARALSLALPQLYPLT